MLVLPPANPNASMIATMMAARDIQVDCMPPAMPAMMTVAGPVSEARDTSRVGLKS